MKKTIFTVIFLLLIIVSRVNAQAVWGLRAGLCIPQISSKASSTNVSNFGWEVGPVLYWSLKNDFYINSGVMFNMKNIKISNSTGEMTLRTSNIEVPLYLGLSFGQKNKVSFYAQAGPYFGLKVSEDENLNSAQYSVQDSENLDFINTFNAGLGVMYGINFNRFKLELGYKYGVTNFIKSQVNDNNVNLSAWFFGISYVF